MPVAFEATLNFANVWGYYLQDDGMAVLAMPVKRAKVDAELQPGDRVLVRGTTFRVYVPAVHAESITLIRHGALPKPITATYNALVSVNRYNMLVSFPARVRSVETTMGLTTDHKLEVRNLILHLIFDGRYVDGVVSDVGQFKYLKGLVDAEIEITGIADKDFDGPISDKMQMTGPKILIPSMADIEVLRRADADPWAVPLTQMGKILADYHLEDQSRRIRVQGTSMTRRSLAYVPI